jgi:hypothetical protein
MAKQGRKLLLNEEMIAKIVDATQWGNYATTICDYVGITTQTLHNWLRKGEELSEVEDRELTEEEQLFVKLFYDIRKARSLSEMRAVEKIRKAGEQDWKAAAWFLERTATSRWGRVDRTEITGAEGGAIEISAESVSRKLEALMAKASSDRLDIVDAEVLDDDDSEPETGIQDVLSEIQGAMQSHSDEPDEPEADTTTV